MFFQYHPVTAFFIVVEGLDVVVGHALGQFDLVERQGNLDLFLELHAMGREAVAGMGATGDVGHARIEGRQFVVLQALDLDLVGVVTGIGINDEFGAVEFEVAAATVHTEGGGGGQGAIGLGWRCRRY